MAAGVTEYQVKLDTEELAETIRKAIRRNASGQAAATSTSIEKGSTL